MSSSQGNPTNVSNQDPRVDDLRQRLRALGYLDAGVDRFVLGSARRTDRPAAIALFASLRIGALAAVLLGPAAAVGLAARLPGLVTGPRDAIVAAVYLGALFGASIAAVAFMAALAAAWATTKTTGSNRTDRRTRMLAVGAGVAVTAACLTYLTLWWRTANGGLGWSSPLWTAFALVVAVGISLLLGHSVTLTALALTVARPESALPTKEVRHWSWKAPLFGGSIAFAGAAALLLATTRAESPAEPPALTVKSSGSRVVLLAIDGFDARVHDGLRPTLGASNSPNLFTVFDAARADLAATDSRDPARLWTTIATGVRPETHGVDALETRRVAGLQGRLGSGSTARVVGAATDLLRLTKPAVASSVERRVKTFWEVAEQAGLRTGAINWWATWPASASEGIVLSDRAVLRLERGGPLDAELAPSSLYDPLAKRWPEIRANARQTAQKHFTQDAGPDSRSPAAGLQAVLTRSGELDATMLQLADAIGARDSLDLLIVYLPGLDVAQHTLLAQGDAPSPSELEARLAALQRYYRFLNALTSEAIAHRQAQTTVLVVTEPGRLHQGPGYLAGIGPGLQSGTRAAGTVLDIAPTILHALGVPISRELDGHVLTALFRPEFLAQYPVRDTETYGVRRSNAAARSGAPLDQEMIDRLRSLGYVK